MRVLHLAILLSCALPSAAFAAAPKQLYGKSITVSWLETRSQRDSQAGPHLQAGRDSLQQYLLYKLRRTGVHAYVRTKPRRRRIERQGGSERKQRRGRCARSDVQRQPDRVDHSISKRRGAAGLDQFRSKPFKLHRSGHRGHAARQKIGCREKHHHRQHGRVRIRLSRTCELFDCERQSVLRTATTLSSAMKTCL